MPGWNNSDPMTAASVAYELQFRVHRGENLVADVVRKVYIFDCNESAPPICVEDFGSEYSANTAISLRRNIFQKVATVAIGTTQPCPLVFMAGADSATTGIPIRACLRLTAEAIELVRGPSQLEVDVSWRLQTSTFVSMLQLTGQPTVSQAVHSRSLVRLVNTGKAHRHKTYWSDWSPSRPSKESSNNRSIEYATEHTIWLSLPSSSVLAPTTSLRCISRRYCILLELKVSGSGRSSSMLKLPIQIVYQSQPANVLQETAAPNFAVASSRQNVPCHSPTLQSHCTGLPPYTSEPGLA